MSPLEQMPLGVKDAVGVEQAGTVVVVAGGGGAPPVVVTDKSLVQES
jgi:hypothetical protein